MDFSIARLLRGVLPLALLLLTACGGGGDGGNTSAVSAANVVGTWKLVTVNSADVSSYQISLVADASTYTIVFPVSFPGQSACTDYGTWSVSGNNMTTTPITGSTCGSTASTATVSISGSTMTRVSPTDGTQVYQKQAANSVAGNALIGTWKMMATDTAGTVIPTYNSSYSLILDTSNYFVTFPTCSETGTWSVSGSVLGFTPNPGSTCGSPATYTSSASLNNPFMTLALTPTKIQIWQKQSGATVPAAPTSPTATAGNGQVTLNWNAVAGATSYNLYWSTTTGVTKLTGTKIPGVSPGLTLNATNGYTYYFVITAVNSAGESVESSQVSVTPYDPMVPQNVTATKYAGFVRICLTDVSGGAAYTYRVYRSNAPGVGIMLANQLNFGSTPWADYAGGVHCNDDYALTSGTTYYYRATSVTSGGTESAGSNEASVAY